MGTKIKICGLSRECDIDFVNQARPDYIGFVFAKSKRQVMPEQAKLLKGKLAQGIVAVGVFVNPSKELVEQLVHDKTIDAIQLHGQEDNNFINSLRPLNVPIIKAVTVQDKTDYCADFLLFDSGSSASPEGGTGRTFDWSRIENTQGKPFFLAGGLNIGNVEDAIQTVSPYALDISGGVETNGVKDRKKIMEIVRRVRNGDK